MNKISSVLIVSLLTAATEGDSEHTIARGIRKSADEKNLDLPEVSDFEALEGRGVRAVYQNNPVYVGGPRLLEMLEIELIKAISQFKDEANNKGQSVVNLVRKP